MDISSIVTWKGPTNPDGRYSRRHDWQFDGGATVAASSAPAIVPLPWSDPGCVDPEEALLAALSSCHMLFFLHYSAQSGLTVEHYEDRASGKLVPDEAGRMHVGSIRLAPHVRFSSPVDPQAHEALHKRAHESCFIAASLRAPVSIEPVLDTEAAMI